MAGQAPAVMVKLTVVTWLGALAAVPCMVTVYVPGESVFALFRVITEELPGTTGFVPKLIDVPAGTPAVADKVIGLVKPPPEIVGRVTFMVAGAGQAVVAGVVAPKLKPEGGGMIALQTPRPWVPAAMVRSDARYLIISVRTLGKLGLATQTVELPLRRSVSHTPVSVAI